MAVSRALKKLPVRQLITQVTQKTRELRDHVHDDVSRKAEDLVDLSRPFRKKSAFPTVRTLRNAFLRLQDAQERARQISLQIDEYFAAIEDRLS